MKTRLLWVALGILALYVMVSTIYGFAVLGTTHDSLCSYYSNLVQDRNESAKFLIDHPHPGPAFGLTEPQVVAQTQQRIERQTNSINSLKGLGCPEPPPLETKETP